MRSTHQQKGFSALFAALGLALLIYTGIRAYVLDFTHDESLSFFGINFIGHWWKTANTHLLNSVLMRVCQELFGPSEFSLRAPNLIAHAIYLVFAYLFSTQIRTTWVRIGGFVLLATNPILLDFFGLARGYGLALCFLMASLYFLTMFLEGPRKPGRHLRNAALCAALGVCANFTLLNYYLSMWSVIGIFCFYSNRTWAPSFKAYKGTLVQHTIFFSVIMAILLYLRLNGRLYYGGINGFFQDTFWSLVTATYYSADEINSAARFVLLGLFIFAIQVGLSACRKARHQRRWSQPVSFILLLIACTLSIQIQHAVFSTPFPLGRTGLYFIPLFTTAFLLCLDEVTDPAQSSGKIIYPAVFAFFCCIIVGNSVRNFNLTRVYYWPNDANTKSMIACLQKKIDHQQDTAALQVGVSASLKPSVNYYRTIQNLQWLARIDGTHFLEGNPDYYFVLASDIKSIRDSGRKITTLQHFAPSNTVLAKRQHPAVPASQ